MSSGTNTINRDPSNRWVKTIFMLKFSPRSRNSLFCMHKDMPENNVISLLDSLRFEWRRLTMHLGGKKAHTLHMTFADLFWPRLKRNSRKLWKKLSTKWPLPSTFLMKRQKIPDSFKKPLTHTEHQRQNSIWQSNSEASVPIALR